MPASGPRWRSCGVLLGWVLGGGRGGDDGGGQPAAVVAGDRVGEGHVVGGDLERRVLRVAQQQHVTDREGEQVLGGDLERGEPHADVHRHVGEPLDRKSTRLNSSHANISYAVFCLKKKKKSYRKILQFGKIDTSLAVR